MLEYFRSKLTKNSNDNKGSNFKINNDKTGMKKIRESSRVINDQKIEPAPNFFFFLLISKGKVCSQKPLILERVFVWASKNG